MLLIILYKNKKLHNIPILSITTKFRCETALHSLQWTFIGIPIFRYVRRVIHGKKLWKYQETSIHYGVEYFTWKAVANRKKPAVAVLNLASWSKAGNGFAFVLNFQECNNNHLFVIHFTLEESQICADFHFIYSVVWMNEWIIFVHFGFFVFMKQLTTNIKSLLFSCVIYVENLNVFLTPLHQ